MAARPETTPSGPEVRFQQVTCRFGPVTAVDAVDLEIAPGTFVALVGASGSGKTTLLKTVNRLVTPSAGTVSIDGLPNTEGDAHALRRRIGYVFQNVGLFPHMTVAQNIGIGTWLAGLGRMAAADVEALLSLVDLPAGHAARLPAELSGGQQQRVGVARALATRPGLMLMDEPFGALDPVTRERLAEEYRALHLRLGLTTIMVTHDMAEALLIADRVLVMAAGRVAGDGTPAEMVAGRCGPEAEALVAVPRAQAERVIALEQGA